MNSIKILIAMMLIGIFSSCEKGNIRKYVVTPDELLVNYLNGEGFVSAEEMLALMKATDGKYRFIDIRTPDLYINGHIKNAVNVPLHDAFNSRYEYLFNSDNVTNIIYGKGNEDVVDLYLMFSELGYDGNKFFKGGYDFITKGGNVKFNPDDEKPAYNFAEKLK
ncbi:MAG: hypothetical protein GXO47_02755, partial [Chlorobi bacterium]|nr:hypothetical protein [Chlorobiota bacterium]